MKKISPRFTAALMVFSGAALCGCAGSFDADAGTSPIAAEVQALVEANRTYPRWADFPQTSTDAPTPGQVATRVATLKAADDRLRTEVGRIAWQLEDPVAYENAVRARLAAVRVSPASQQTAAEIETYAEQLRARAKAPPPIGRRQ